MQAAKVNKSLQFRRCLRDFLAPVWGLPLVAVCVPVHDKIRSEGFAVFVSILRWSGGALMHFVGIFVVMLVVKNAKCQLTRVQRCRS
jgi:hypothetical protein